VDNDNLVADNNKVKADNNLLVAENGKVKADNDKLVADNNKAKVDNDLLVAENGKVKVDNAKLLADNGKVKADNDLLNAENGKVKADNVKLQADNGKVKADNDLLNAENGKVKVDNAKLQADNGKVKVDNDLLKAENGKVKDDNDLLKAENGKVKVDNDLLNAENGKVKADNDKLVTDNNKVKTDNDLLKAENGKVKNDNDLLKAENGKVKADNDKLAADSGRIKADNDRLAAETGKIKADNDKLLADNGKIKADNDKLLVDNGKIKADNDRLAADNDFLATDNSKLAANNGFLAADKTKLVADNGILLVDNDQFKMNNEELGAQIQLLSVELETVGSDANLYQEVFTQIRGNVDNAKTEIQGMAIYEIPGIDSLALVIQDMDNTLAGAIIQDPDTPSGDGGIPSGDGIMPNDGGTASSSQIASWQAYPSGSGYYIAAYEDLYPSPGDYDFNDLAVAYRLQLGLDDANQLVAIKGNAYLIARGAGYTHDWHLRIGLPAMASGTITSSLYTHSAEAMSDGSRKRPVFENRQRSFSGDLDLLAFADSRKLAPVKAPCYYFNTQKTCEYVKGPLFEFRVEFDTPVDPSLVAGAPFDPYLFVRGSGSGKYEIHLPDQKLATNRRTQGYDDSDNQSQGLTSFIDEFGFPFAIIAPDEWSPPYEMVDLADAYPDSVDIQSTGDFLITDWYKSPVPEMVQKAGRFEWEWSTPAAAK
jgi:LruC domain-containing protein